MHTAAAKSEGTWHSKLAIMKAALALLQMHRAESKIDERMECVDVGKCAREASRDVVLPARTSSLHSGICIVEMLENNCSVEISSRSGVATYLSYEV